MGIEGAKECGDFEEWFNYRVSRAAPETCAEFLGSFIADKTSSQFTKGGKWLVWRFEVCQQTLLVLIHLSQMSKIRYIKLTLNEKIRLLMLKERFNVSVALSC